MHTHKKATRVNNAYDRLKADILQSDLPPGFQAPEPEIAERLGMSRTPVREALIRLEADGLVELVPRRGARVLGMSQQDFREIYDLLCALEPLVIRDLFTEEGGVIDDESAARLEAVTVAMDDAETRGDIDAWAEADMAFHLGLARLSANRRLGSFIECLFDQAYRGKLVLLRLNRKPISNGDDHRKILFAIKAGRRDEAVALVRAHRERAGDTLCRVFTECRLAQI